MWRAVGKFEAGQSEAEVAQWADMIPQLSCSLAADSGKRLSRQTVYSRLAEIGLYDKRPVLYIPLMDCLVQQERTDLVELKTSVMDTTIIQTCSFQ
ncbi:hypothetical protein TNCV_1224631 [Trichonephila clavipes]|nr:hypothetical protein TNCV_1224631 [Trichonephila clavipes]